MKKYLIALALGVGLVLAFSSCSKDSSPGAGPAPVAEAGPVDPAPQNELGLGPAAVDLKSAGNYAILTKEGISNAPSSSITGNIGVSPAAGSFITGFSCDDLVAPSKAVSVGALAAGFELCTSQAEIDPVSLTAAIGDMGAAYDDAAGRSSPDFTEHESGLLGGLTLSPGLYKWSSAVLIDSDLVLTGGPNDVFILQIAQTLTIASGVSVILDGVLAKNVFWQVAEQVTLVTSSVFEGVILSKTAIVMQNGAELNGRAYAQAEVTLIQNTVTQPAE